ncbi:MAG TPA: DUF952 domain-containing protein [Kofleriaceae bacterium]|nr:DUF952 domain-containing protein [Kofleriaceae bacterium]
MTLLLHITTRADWDAARAAGSYRPASLAAEGFIHCSTPAQTLATANQFFPGRTDLVLLCIDEARVAPLVRYEAPAPVGGAPDARADQRFPHLYGPLDLDAVVKVVPFPCDRDGSFTLPAEAGARP